MHANPTLPAVYITHPHSTHTSDNTSHPTDPHIPSVFGKPSKKVEKERKVSSLLRASPRGRRGRAECGSCLATRGERVSRKRTLRTRGSRNVAIVALRVARKSPISAVSDVSVSTYMGSPSAVSLSIWVGLHNGTLRVGVMNQQQPTKTDRALGAGHVASVYILQCAFSAHTSTYMDDHDADRERYMR